MGELARGELLLNQRNYRNRNEAISQLIRATPGILSLRSHRIYPVTRTSTMSIGSNFQRFSRPSAPERGSFPLDLDGECKSAAKDFMNCIKQAQGKHSLCRDLSRAYLQCRMDHGLMVRDDMKNLGFQDLEERSMGSIQTSDVLKEGQG
ncbi:hypothetical protein SeMB42_g02878 [Synchytrium endobioticum]|uniref:CHCH domain-containing protein n=1 Tax=Synchytrium endobioticum TaxID=286115 RepID=A0A507DCW5_9FUNG|nr:hypothetical protein SeLEV6574_g06424 [Synchytrium endobioticum]TPX48720.1 hypothetical protein SeMB42_g02878 [Synchytrium endobioticum]